MQRVTLLAGFLFVLFPSMLHAFPNHEIVAGIGLHGGKLESQLGYTMQASDSSGLKISAHIDDDFSGSFMAANQKNGFGAYGGNGNPVNSIALRYTPQVAEIEGRPLPWFSSSDSSGMTGMGLRFGLIDFLMILDGSIKLEEISKEMLLKLATTAVQVSSIGNTVSGGVAFSIGNPKRESYGEGWSEAPFPFPGGIMSTLSASGKVSLKDFMIEAWSALSVGILELPGFAFILRCIWEIYKNPCIRLNVFSYLSSDRYRNWLGDSPEYDLVVSALMQADWDVFTLRLDGKILSLNDADTSWNLTQGRFGLRFVAKAISMQGDIQFGHEGLDAASGKLGYRMDLRMSHLNHLDFSLTAKKNDSISYSAGVTLGWKISPDTHSKGEIGIQLSVENMEEAHAFSILGNFSQNISLHRWGFASIDIKTPAGGYRLGAGKFLLPDANVGISLSLPTPGAAL